MSNKKKEEYVKLSDGSHVLLRPGMYVGNIRAVEKSMDVYSPETNSMVTIVMSFICALERIFLEVLSNAADNYTRSLEHGYKNIPATETVFSKRYFSVKNGGRPLSCAFNEAEQMYTPQLVFSNMRSGSNFDEDDKRKWAGTHGIGATLAAIFAIKFVIEVVNHEEGVKYVQVFKENLEVIEEPKIEEFEGDASYVKVTVWPDFKYFYAPPVDSEHKDMENPDDDIEPTHCRRCWTNMKAYKELGIWDPTYIQLAAKASADFAFNTGGVFSFESKVEDCKFKKVFDIKDPKIFAFMAFPDLKDYKNIVSGVFDDGDTRIVIFDTPDDGKIVSYANGMPTREGGYHVDAWCRYLLSIVKADLLKDKDPKTKVDIRAIKKHITMVLAVRVPNPDYANNDKFKLVSGNFKTVLKPVDVKKIKKWEFVNAMKKALDVRLMKKFNKSNSGTGRFIHIEGVDDAKWAKTKRWQECTATLCEGNSAQIFWQKGIKFTKGGRDTEGCFPLRGKPKNATNVVDLPTLMKNKVYSNLAKFLGLECGGDYSSKSTKSYKKLRYGCFQILVDADVDGSHIKMLLLDFFSKFEGLLELGIVKILLTPMITVSKGKKIIYLYSDAEYEKWLSKIKTEDMKKWKTCYFKGLGTATKTMIETTFTKPILQKIIVEEGDTNILQIAFNQEFADIRKRLYTRLAKRNPSDYLDITKITSLKGLICEELILFAVTSNRRAIPAFDGFKDSLRKIVWVLLDIKKENCVEELTGMIKAKTKYRHGPEALKNAIKGLGFGHPGSNNIKLFEANGGDLGSKLKNGKDSPAARYVIGAPAEAMKYLFRSEDKIIYDYIVEDGKTIGVRNLYAVIPVFLVNQCNGIGWGWSTTLYEYNPMTIIKWIRYFLAHTSNGGINVKTFKPPDLLPWWRNYKGMIFRSRSGAIYNRGQFEVLEDGTVFIQELPAYMSGESYVTKIMKMIGKERFDSYDKCGTNPNRPQFLLYNGTDKYYTHASLCLEDKLTETNMVLLGNDDVPVCYTYGVQEIMMFTSRLRYKAYAKRKEKQHEATKKEILKKTLKMHFIEDVISKPPKLELRNRPEEEIASYMKLKGYPPEFLKFPLSDLSKEKAEALKAQIMKLVEGNIKLANTHPADLWLKDLQDLEDHLNRAYPGQWEYLPGYGTCNQKFAED